MVHPWITQDGKEPCGDDAKEKRVSVTKEDIEYAVSLPSHTVKHLRSMSNHLNDEDCKQNDDVKKKNKSRGSKKKKKSNDARKSSPNAVSKNYKIKKLSNGAKVRKSTGN